MHKDLTIKFLIMIKVMILLFSKTKENDASRLVEHNWLTKINNKANEFVQKQEKDHRKTKL